MDEPTWLNPDEEPVHFLRSSNVPNDSPDAPYIAMYGAIVQCQAHRRRRRSAGRVAIDAVRGLLCTRPDQLSQVVTERVKGEFTLGTLPDEGIRPLSPSIGNITPLMYEATGESKKQMTAATSSG
jgi:hypothetical protein